ncbi:hypothetical protein GL218_02771 [Daldinia childiae]|uniref:uncharacterized protein n=1 Tax=Daldinia childiae TaxID=326645 RepID=UPI001444B28E|nr:uncharacterized protein GL218_02771 [Daldinia childiae]KAF3064451.1 hypothetical protein GL218_02771 [Daldinia childiae]
MERGGHRRASLSIPLELGSTSLSWECIAKHAAGDRRPLARQRGLWDSDRIAEHAVERCRWDRVHGKASVGMPLWNGTATADYAVAGWGTVGIATGTVRELRLIGSDGSGGVRDR